VDLVPEDDLQALRISGTPHEKLVERQPAVALSRATVLVRSTANGAETVRVALALTELTLSPRLGLPLAPFQIARGAAGVVRPLRHGPILTGAEAIFDVRRDVRRIRAFLSSPERMNRSTSGLRSTKRTKEAHTGFEPVLPP
jgi:hypothetical protein